MSRQFACVGGDCIGRHLPPLALKLAGGFPRNPQILAARASREA
jgi:hypothetical protein